MALVLSPFILAACSFEQYLAKPIDPAVNIAHFDQKDPTSKGFNDFLISQGYQANQLPISAWGLEELTYCALYFNPNLALARAQWQAAEASAASSNESTIPRINANLARSNDPDPAKKPYSLGFNIDLTADIANKRGLRTESAQHLAKAAELAIAQTAWQLRDKLAQSLLDYQYNQEKINLLSLEKNHQQVIVGIYQKRLDLGAASNIEVSMAKRQLQTNAALLNQATQAQLSLKNQLASHMGIPVSRLEKMPLKLSASMPENANWPSSDLQKHALLNRTDLRIALEQYAAKEAKLKLEIAKQYPDLTISPGYAYEFADSVWSLGVSGLLSMLNKNKLAIAEARQLREVEATQFEALQTKIIGEAYATNAARLQTQEMLKNQQAALKEQRSYERRMVSLFAAGEIDRLALTLTQIETVAIEKSAAAAQHDLNTAIRQLENTLQKPLTGSGVKHEP